MAAKTNHEVPYVRRPYPRWIEGLDGVRKIVHNAEHETRETGILMNPDGTKAEAAEPHIEQPRKLTVERHEKIMPPKLETVLSRGYLPDVAEKIVAQEQRKFEAGNPPYGDTPFEPEPEPAKEPVQVGQQAAAASAEPEGTW